MSIQDCQQLINYWDLVPATVGGVIGALAGGIPAWLLSKKQLQQTLERDKEQRKEREKSLAFSASVKLIVIINSIINLYSHVKSCLSLLEGPAHKDMEPWQVLIPMIGHSDEGSIRFTAEEMAVFVAANESSFMQDMMLLALRHASSLSTLNEYNSRRIEFQKNGPTPDFFEGRMGSSTLTREQFNQYQTYTIPLNDIALALSKGLEEDLKLARTVAEKFGPITKSYFKVEEFISIKLPTDEELEIKRKKAAAQI